MGVTCALGLRGYEVFFEDAFGVDGSESVVDRREPFRVGHAVPEAFERFLPALGNPVLQNDGHSRGDLDD